MVARYNLNNLNIKIELHDKIIQIIDFYNVVNQSDIYVDKTLLIEQTNKVLFGKQRFVCISRPRRFGKSMAANMLTAYYSRGCDSRELFTHIKYHTLKVLNSISTNTTLSALICRNL